MLVLTLHVVLFDFLDQWMEREQQQARRDRRYRTCHSNSKKSQELPTVDPALFNINYNAAFEPLVDLATYGKDVLAATDGIWPVLSSTMGRGNVKPHASHHPPPSHRPLGEVDEEHKSSYWGGLPAAVIPELPIS